MHPTLIMINVFEVVRLKSSREYRHRANFEMLPMVVPVPSETASETLVMTFSQPYVYVVMRKQPVCTCVATTYRYLQDIR